MEESDDLRSQPQELRGAASVSSPPMSRQSRKEKASPNSVLSPSAPGGEGDGHKPVKKEKGSPNSVPSPSAPGDKEAPLKSVIGSSDPGGGGGDGGNGPDGGRPAVFNKATAAANPNTHRYWQLVYKHRLEYNNGCLLYTSPSPRDS